MIRRTGPEEEVQTKLEDVTSGRRTMLFVKSELCLTLIFFDVMICYPKPGHRCPEGARKVAKG